MNKLNINKTGYVVGIVSAGFFLVCSVWSLFLGSTALKDLHFKILQIAYPGFSFTVAGYIIGLVESFVYGWVIGASFAWLCGKICIGERN